jgi:hypothetical protein
MASILDCFGCGKSEPECFTYPDEKLALLAAAQDPHKAELIANDIADTILQTDIDGPALQMKLDSMVGTYGWTENIAKRVLDTLSHALQEGHEKLGPTIRDAYHKACEVAKSIEGFVIEHPVFCTVVALGVLALVAPEILGWLGFAEQGIVEGKIRAARYWNHHN